MLRILFPGLLGVGSRFQELQDFVKGQLDLDCGVPPLLNILYALVKDLQVLRTHGALLLYYFKGLQQKYFSDLLGVDAL